MRAALVSSIIGLSVLAGATPALAGHTTLAPATFQVDLCKRTVSLFGGAPIAPAVQPTAACQNGRTLFVPFSTSLLCAGKIVVKQGNVNVTAQYTVPLCSGL